ncbi:MAG: hypothetical protein WBB67_01615 [bacterium]
MISLVLIFIVGSYVPSASINLKGFSTGCFPFYLDEQTTFLTYPAMIDNSKSHFIGIGKYSTYLNFVRLSAHIPCFSMATLDFYHDNQIYYGNTALNFRHGIAIKKFGILYNIEYTTSYYDTIDEYRRQLFVGKVNYEGFKNLLLNVGWMSSKLKYAEYGFEYPPGWLVGPIVEVRYSYEPFSLFVNSRHPESLQEIYSLTLYSGSYPGYDYSLYPFEAGIGYCDSFTNDNILVIGLHMRYLYEVMDTVGLSVDMSTMGATFVTGYEVHLAEYLALRGGFEVDYTTSITDSSTSRLMSDYTMGGSLYFGERFRIDIRTKNLSTPLESDAILRWFF